MTTPSPEALAELIREKSRYPSGVARMSKALALEIASEALSAPPHLPPAEPVAEQKPVAWMYHHPGEFEHGFQRYSFKRRIQSYEGMSCNEEDAGVIETPLYARPEPIFVGMNRTTYPMGDEALVERVGRALWFDHVDQHGYPNGLPTWDELAAEEGLASDTAEYFYSLARAAIQAIPAPATVERVATGGLAIAYGIVEADLEAAKESGDGDWIGLSQDALDALAAIQAIPAPATDAGQSADSLVEAAGDLIAVIDSVDGEADYTPEEWAALGSAKLHAEDRIRAALASLPKSPSAGEEA